jgi:hypothetical protein
MLVFEYECDVFIKIKTGKKIVTEISGSHGGEYEHDSSGMLRRVIWYKFTDVSEVLAASVVTHRPDDGGSKGL